MYVNVLESIFNIVKCLIVFYIIIINVYSKMEI